MQTSRRVVVPFGEVMADALWKLSERQYRHPRDQVLLIVRDALVQEGLLDESEENLTAAVAGK